MQEASQKPEALGLKYALWYMQCKPLISHRNSETERKSLIILNTELRIIAIKSNVPGSQLTMRCSLIADDGLQVCDR